MKISSRMLRLGENAKNAIRNLRSLTSTKKNEVLGLLSSQILESKATIIKENQKDMQFGVERGLSESMLDRLYIDQNRLNDIVRGVETVMNLPDPVGSLIEEFPRPNGLLIKKVRTPIGVIGVIFESRPNVTVDAGALCFKSGNASILRCGSESYNTSKAFELCFIKSFKQAGVSEYAMQLVPTRDRSAVKEMLNMTDYFDVIVPRGGKGLVSLVQTEARVPVFAHLEGIVHIYIHASADPQLAKDVILNSKVRRPGICGAVECLLIDKEFIRRYGTSVLNELVSAGVKIKASSDLLHVEGTLLADQTDWGKEFLDMTVAVRTVKNINEAISHIEQYGSHHTDCIITEDDEAADEFFLELDSAILMRNASTQFADGGEFGFGAEIGIATGKLHARGPVGLEQLTSFKYLVNGNGQVRS